VQRIHGTLPTVALDTRQVTVSGTPVVAAAMANHAACRAPAAGGGALVAVALVFLLVRWTTAGTGCYRC